MWVVSKDIVSGLVSGFEGGERSTSLWGMEMEGRKELSW
jgi:hypothetical protein